MRWMPAATGWFESGVRPVFIARRARSMVGGRRKKPRARQGADVQIGPAAKSSSPGCRDRGSGSYDPTGYEVGRECALSVRPELTETNTLHLTCGPSYDFGRRQHRHFPHTQPAGVQKASRHEVAGRLTPA